MRFISPEILHAASGLSVGAAGFTLFVGLLLWSCGWRWHKFWVVFGITAAAGIIGLSVPVATGSQVLVLGVLLAFAGGVMALEVAKLLAFAGGGLAAWLAVQTVLPQAHEMWAVFLAGGLFGVLLYKLWTMMLTSFFGALLTLHAAIALTSDAGAGVQRWTAENAMALNGVVIALTLLGIVTQVIVSRESKEAEEEEEDEKPVNRSTKKSWWKQAA